MENNLPEIFFASSDKSISKLLSKLIQEKKIIKLFPRVYTSNLSGDPATIVRRNIYQILGNLYPGAIVSHRSALEGGLIDNKVIFLTYKYTKKIEIPGIIIRLQQGPGALSDDRPFIGGLYISSIPRAILENLQQSRDRGSSAKTLHARELERFIEKQIKIHGEDKINQIRDRAREISKEYKWEKEFGKFDKIVGAMLQTHPSRILKSPIALARAFGIPYDKHRLDVFQQFFTALKTTLTPFRLQDYSSEVFWRNTAFIETYFSNFIEGTEFKIEEAERIIFDNKIPETRPDDAHDIIGTYRIVSNRYEMKIIPKNDEELITLLKKRHAVLMGGRLGKNPGQFKEKPNRAGQTEFVSPKLVVGTLKKGFEIYNALEEPFARSVFMMFLISEVHPFNDGNGRIARIMMNAELIHAGSVKIIIPTVYRDDYLESLRALSRTGRTGPIIEMADRAQQFTSEIDFSNLSKALQVLRQCNAFDDHNRSRLIMPRNVSDDDL